MSKVCTKQKDGTWVCLHGDPVPIEPLKNITVWSPPAEALRVPPGAPTPTPKKKVMKIGPGGVPTPGEPDDMGHISGKV